jgi:hypothetical protein
MLRISLATTLEGFDKSASDSDLRRFMRKSDTAKDRDWHEQRIGRLMDELSQEIATTPRAQGFRRALLLLRDIMLEHLEEEASTEPRVHGLR